MYRILKYLLYFVCLFIANPKLKGKIRTYARSCESINRVKRTALSVGKNLRALGKVRVNESTIIGDNVRLNDGFKIEGAGKVVFGNNISTGKYIYVIAQNHDYTTGLPFGKGLIFKDIIIEDNVWIGARVTLLPGAVIREGAIIQAGSVVVNEIPKCAVAGGHPAKPYKYRDIDEYERMKADLNSKKA